MDIKAIDSNLADSKKSSTDICWYNPLDNYMFRLSGFPYIKEEKQYERLPQEKRVMIEQINPNLLELGRHTAGGQVAFRTNSSKIILRAKLLNRHSMSTMAATGESGFDIYVGRDKKEPVFYGVTKFDISKQEYECELASGLPTKECSDIIIHFPLYNGVTKLEIGLDEMAEIKEPKPYTKKGRILFYGTSITQGGCASRPGMAYTNLISRWLNRECINFGFSGNGFGEVGMGEIIGEIDDLSMVVLDYEANAGTNGKIEAGMREFIQTIRRYYPAIPILVVSRIPYILDAYEEKLAVRRSEIREFQKKLVEEFKVSGDEKIYFLDGSDLLGKEYEECTVDLIHPTDLGFFVMAKGLCQEIRKVEEGL